MESCSNQNSVKQIKYIFYLSSFEVAALLMTALHTLGKKALE